MSHTMDTEAISRIVIGTYKGLAINVGYRVDVLVESALIVELKVVERILRVHEAQLLAYLKLSGLQVGLLMNFHVPRLRLGIRRMVNNYTHSRSASTQNLR